MSALYDALRANAVDVDECERLLAQVEADSTSETIIEIRRDGRNVRFICACSM